MKSCLLAAVAALLLLGCGRDIHNKSAVRQAVIDHLSGRSGLELGSMDVEVTSVSFRENEAEAVVSFRPKGGASSSGMAMKYVLERQGSKWAVKDKSEAGGGGFHGESGEGGGGELPAGHPPLGGDKGSKPK